MKAPIRVVISNPPYSAGQESANDNNQNLSYPNLDERIRKTYAANSAATLQRNLYDSYIRAIRWASDRIEERGIIGFVTNGSFIDANNMDGLRGCLMTEFASVYVFNLRGNARTQGELRRAEAGNVFGAGTRTPVSLTLLVKNTRKTDSATLRYFEIGDFLSREEKLESIRKLKSINGVQVLSKWKTITPNEQHDWINQRDPAFERFIPLSSEESLSFFSVYSPGAVTSRDAWAYNRSRKALAENVSNTINFYNENLSSPEEPNSDSRRISWSRGLRNQLKRGKRIQFDKSCIINASYRPFDKRWMYYHADLIESPGRQAEYFPNKLANSVISIVGNGTERDFSALITGNVADFHFHDTSKLFPRYHYEAESANRRLSLAAEDDEIIDGYRRREAITDAILKKFREAYGPRVTKEDIFYYVYGVLHSPEYRRRFAADLKKMLPRIPFTKETADFKAFSKAGRNLAEWHLSYETIEPYKVKEQADSLNFDKDEQFKVQKMTFARPTAEQKARGEKWDKSKINYNSHITLTGIPLEAYEYVVNGKPAIEWIMERYQVTRDKDSGITNDPNDWCKEHNQPRYIIDLVKRIIRVSLETMKIVKALPALNERQ